MLFKNSVPTSQETHSFPATNTNRLMLFTEIIYVCCENRMKKINALFIHSEGLLNVKAGGTYRE
jgi:hypothetical protein